MAIMQGFDVYRTFIAMKQHFSNEKFDFFQYAGKANVSETTYKSRSDYWFFETLSRKLKQKEVRDFILATFIKADNPSQVWVGDIKQNGQQNLLDWKRKQESLSYIVSQDIEKIAEILEEQNLSFNDLFLCKGSHPPLLKLFIKNKINIETLVILDIILDYVLQWDRKLKDPLWKKISFKIKKYKPFLSINRDQFKTILKEKFL